MVTIGFDNPNKKELLYFRQYKISHLQKIIINIIDSCDHIIQSELCEIKNNFCSCIIPFNSYVYAAEIYTPDEKKKIGRYII